MRARKHFRRLLATVLLTTVLLGVALISPVLLGRLLSGEQAGEQGALLTCLFIPTPADWPSHILSYTLVAVLGLGAICGLHSLVRQWYRTRRLTRALLEFALPTRSKELARRGVPNYIAGRLDLVDMESPVAFCYGWVRPRICVSTGALAGLHKREVAALLLHEYHHLLRRDPLKTAVSRVLGSAFFFLPIVQALHEQYMVAKEIDADEYALCMQGSDQPLLAALYKLLLKQPQSMHKRSGLTVVGASDSVAQRLDYLLEGRQPAGPRIASLFVSSSVLAAITALMAFTTWTTSLGALWHQAHSGLGGC